MAVSFAKSMMAPFSRTLEEGRPSKLLVALEGRAVLEWLSVPWALPLLNHYVPRGDGHAVLVLPGLLAGDGSTAPLRRFLRLKGYDAHGWEQGRNFGPRPGVRAQAEAQLDRLHRESGRKVSLIGWSLGGIFAREIARAFPDQVRQVITLGSPLYGDPAQTNAWDVYRIVSDSDTEDRRGDEAPPVPTTSIYSRGDSVVGWGCSVERSGPMTDNIEINSATHMGLGAHPLVWYAVGDRLAQAENHWQHFDASGLRRVLFPFRAPERH
ncbi:MAG: lipase family alpha/beta hydrolase [Burkholderiaceae bacterium]